MRLLLNTTAVSYLLFALFTRAHSGVIFDGKDLYFVEPRNGSSLADEHVIVKHSDLSVNLTCGKT